MFLRRPAPDGLHALAGSVLPDAPSLPGLSQSVAPRQSRKASAQITVMQAGRTDYAMNGGSVLPSSFQNYSPFPHFQGPTGVVRLPVILALLTSGSTLTSFNGIATSHSQVLDATITDSRETTYLIGEKYMSVDNYVTGNDATNPASTIRVTCAVRCRRQYRPDSLGQRQPAAQQDRTASNNPPANPSQIFGSSHGAGWHVAFCDGHVQSIGWGSMGNCIRPSPRATGTKWSIGRCSRHDAGLRCGTSRDPFAPRHGCERACNPATTRRSLWI